MRIEYDRSVDVAYIYFREIAAGEVVRTVALSESVSADLDTEGKTVGIEILHASKNLPRSALQNAVVIE